VVVALRTLERQAQERRADDLNSAVEHRNLVCADLVGVAVALARAVLAIAEEMGGDELIDDRGGDLDPRLVARKLVAGQLLADDLVERLVGIERPDHVVAVTVGQGPIGIGTERKPLLLESGLDETIDGGAHARGITRNWWKWNDYRPEGPVIGPRTRASEILAPRQSLRSLLDPAANQGFLGAGERLLGLRRHLGGGNPIPQRALLERPGLDDRSAFPAARQRSGAGEVQFPLGLDRPMALDAAGFQQRLNVVVEGWNRGGIGGARSRPQSSPARPADRLIGMIGRGSVIVPAGTSETFAVQSPSGRREKPVSARPPSKIGRAPGSAW